MLTSDRERVAFGEFRGGSGSAGEATSAPDLNHRGPKALIRLERGSKTRVSVGIAVDGGGSS